MHRGPSLLTVITRKDTSKAEAGLVKPRGMEAQMTEGLVGILSDELGRFVKPPSTVTLPAQGTRVDSDCVPAWGPAAWHPASALAHANRVRLSLRACHSSPASTALST